MSSIRNTYTPLSQRPSGTKLNVKTMIHQVHPHTPMKRTNKNFMGVNLDSLDSVRPHLAEKHIEAEIQSDIETAALENKSYSRGLSQVVKKFFSNPELLEERLKKKFGDRWCFNNIPQTMNNIRTRNDGSFTRAQLEIILTTIGANNYHGIDDILEGIKMFKRRRYNNADACPHFADFSDYLLREGYVVSQKISKKSLSDLLWDLREEKEEEMAFDDDDYSQSHYGFEDDCYYEDDDGILGPLIRVQKTLGLVDYE